LSSLGRDHFPEAINVTMSDPEFKLLHSALSVLRLSLGTPLALIGSKPAKSKDFAEQIIFVTCQERMRLDWRIPAGALGR
jgi:hypothetical protein